MESYTIIGGYFDLDLWIICKIYKIKLKTNKDNLFYTDEKVSNSRKEDNHKAFIVYYLDKYPWFQLQKDKSHLEPLKLSVSYLHNILKI